MPSAGIPSTGLGIRQMESCPACSSTHFKPRTPYPLQQYGAGTHLPTTYQLMACDECGLWFKNPMPSEEALREYYDGVAAETSPWNYGTRWPHERALDRLLAKMPDGSRVLDVGCWTGRLLSPHLPRLKTFGIEPNRTAARTAEKNGLQILGARIDESIQTNGSFDCITMVDLFEHLREPMKTLKLLVSSLAPGGILYLVTGRTNCTAVRLNGPSYWYFGCPDHLIFLNRRFVRWLGKTIKGVSVDFRDVRHFDFRWSAFFREIAWMMAWRFLSPHSPYKKIPLYRLPGFKRFERLREPMMCGSWNDHALVEIYSQPTAAI